MQHIENKLKNGFVLHGFRSGSGIRVVNFKDCNDGYGESYCIELALQNADEQLKNKTPYRSDYLTGTSESSSNLDKWVRNGLSFDLSVNECSHYTFEGRYWQNADKIPEYIHKAVQKNPTLKIKYKQYDIYHAIIGNNLVSSCVSPSPIVKEERITFRCYAKTLEQFLVHLNDFLGDFLKEIDY